MQLLLRFRLLVTRLLRSVGLNDDPFPIALAVLVGLVASFAALGFHALVTGARSLLFYRADAAYLYGPGLYLLLVVPCLGGLAVGLARRFAFGKQGLAGHGVVDVIESVLRSRSFAKPHSALETALLSAATLGSGGSTGAEGPIVQIGGALASGIARLFSMPPGSTALLVAAGAAGGISAIFNAPLGGVLFTLELILLDFSARSLAPVVVASVVANVTSQVLFRDVLHEPYSSIFALPSLSGLAIPSLLSLVWIALAGLLAGTAGAALTRGLMAAEHRFAELRMPSALKPALGGLLIGILALLWLIGSRLTTGFFKPFDLHTYHLPAFFSDGYGIIRTLIDPTWYAQWPAGSLLILLTLVVVAKVLATVITLSSGGVGGVIAPALFVGVACGALVGTVARACGSPIAPELCALAGMAGGLAAVVHAPLASALILVETAGSYHLLVPGMLAVVVAMAVSRLLAPESLYSHALKRRGLRLSSTSPRDFHSRTLGDIPLQPARVISAGTPASDLLQIIDGAPGAVLMVVASANGRPRGLLTEQEIEPLRLAPELYHLVTAVDLARPTPALALDTDLAAALDAFLTTETPALIVTTPAQIAGTLSRTDLLKHLTTR